MSAGAEGAHDPEAVSTAGQCRHYAMCRIDYLGNGLCPPGEEGGFVSYYPQGRMDIYARYAAGRLHLTEGLVDVALSCTGCCRCDLQCHFTAELLPSRVALALRREVERELDGREPEPRPRDPLLEEMRALLAPERVTADPAHLAAYCSDPSPVSVDTLPRFVALPSCAEEVQALVRLCRREGMEYTVRGNGSSVMGFVLGSGLILDMSLMGGISVDRRNWCATVGAGVSAFELQRAAGRVGCRVNAGEPAALYCANMVCSGVFSLFSTSCGTCADNIVDAEFVSPEGELFRLSERDAPNAYAFRMDDMPPPGVCTRAVVRLHPKEPDESAVAVPFEGLAEAVEYARELAEKGIGTGIGVLGVEYLSTFVTPTSELARGAREVFGERLGMTHLVMVLGGGHHLDAAADLAPAVLDADILRMLVLGMPELAGGALAEMLEGIEGGSPPFRLLAEPGMGPLLEALLDPSPERLAGCVPEELREAYRELYARPEMSDALWLNTFRVVSARMGREGHVVAFIVYIPLDDASVAVELDGAFGEIVERRSVRGALGFVTPLDRGRRAVLEWDMYLDHTDPEQVGAMRLAMADAAEMLARFHERDDRVVWIRWLFNQGFCRKESLLYHGASLG